MKRPSRKELEIENAHLRGQVTALERQLAAARAWAPVQAPPPADWITLPATIPYCPPATFGHGGLCACPQCCQPVTCGTITVTAVDEIVIGGPQRSNIVCGKWQ